MRVSKLHGASRFILAGLVKFLLFAIRRYSKYLLVGSSFICFFWAQQSYAQTSYEDVKQLLLQSARSIKTTNYQGFFTYQHGSVLDSVEIVHRYKDGKETEKVKRLNGVPGEFTRSSKNTSCDSSSGSFVSESASISSVFPAIALFKSEAGLGLSENYAFYLRGTRRYADRAATVIQLVPKDQRRYGLMMALDQVTGLPLMIVLLDVNNKPLERFQFVHLNFSLPLDLALESEVYDESIGQHQYGVQDCEEPAYDSKWVARWVPKGFVLAKASTGNGLDRLHFTDGVASFTLFIGAKKQDVPSTGGASRRGATTAVMTLAAVGDQPIHISLVGEVPLSVARQVIESVYLKP